MASVGRTSKPVVLRWDELSMKMWKINLRGQMCLFLFLCVSMLQSSGILSQRSHYLKNTTEICGAIWWQSLAVFFPDTSYCLTHNSWKIAQFAILNIAWYVQVCCAGESNGNWFSVGRQELHRHRNLLRVWKPRPKVFRLGSEFRQVDRGKPVFRRLPAERVQRETRGIFYSRTASILVKGMQSPILNPSIMVDWQAVTG